jgi:hypothetical protein
VTGRIDRRAGLHFDVLEPRVTVQLSHLAPEVGVGAVAREGHGEDLADPSERRTRWIAEPELGVGLQPHHAASGLREPHHLGQHLGRARHGDKQRPRVYEVERVRWQLAVAGIGAHHLDPAQATPCRHLRCHLDVHGVGIQTDDPAPRHHPLRQQFDHSPRSAADVDRRVAGLQADVIQQRGAVGHELIGLPFEALALAAAGAKRVGRVGVNPYARGRAAQR